MLESMFVLWFKLVDIVVQVCYICMIFFFLIYQKPKEVCKNFQMCVFLLVILSIYAFYIWRLCYLLRIASFSWEVFLLSYIMIDFLSKILYILKSIKKKKNLIQAHIKRLQYMYRVLYNSTKRSGPACSNQVHWYKSQQNVWIFRWDK